MANIITNEKDPNNQNTEEQPLLSNDPISVGGGGGFFGQTNSQNYTPSFSDTNFTDQVKAQNQNNNATFKPIYDQLETDKTASSNAINQSQSLFNNQAGPVRSWNNDVQTSIETGVRLGQIDPAKNVLNYQYKGPTSLDSSLFSTNIDNLNQNVSNLVNPANLGAVLQKYNPSMTTGEANYDQMIYRNSPEYNTLSTTAKGYLGDIQNQSQSAQDNAKSFGEIQLKSAKEIRDNAQNILNTDQSNIFSNLDGKIEQANTIDNNLLNQYNQFHAGQGTYNGIQNVKMNWNDLGGDGKVIQQSQTVSPNDFLSWLNGDTATRQNMASSDDIFHLNNINEIEGQNPIWEQQLRKTPEIKFDSGSWTNALKNLADTAHYQGDAISNILNDSYKKMMGQSGTYAAGGTQSFNPYTGFTSNQSGTYLVMGIDGKIQQAQGQNGVYNPAVDGYPKFSPSSGNLTNNSTFTSGNQSKGDLSFSQTMQNYFNQPIDTKGTKSTNIPADTAFAQDMRKALNEILPRALVSNGVSFPGIGSATSTLINAVFNADTLFQAMENGDTNTVSEALGISYGSAGAAIGGVVSTFSGVPMISILGGVIGNAVGKWDQLGDANSVYEATKVLGISPGNLLTTGAGIAMGPMGIVLGIVDKITGWLFNVDGGGITHAINWLFDNLFGTNYSGSYRQNDNGTIFEPLPEAVRQAQNNLNVQNISTPINQEQLDFMYPSTLQDQYWMQNTATTKPYDTSSQKVQSQTPLNLLNNAQIFGMNEVPIDTVKLPENIITNYDMASNNVDNLSQRYGIKTGQGTNSANYIDTYTSQPLTVVQGEQYSQNLADTIKEAEGWNTKGGIWGYGYGSMDPRAADSKEMANQLLNEELSKKASIVAGRVSGFDALPQNIKDPLIDIAFNWGENHKQSKPVWEAASTYANNPSTANLEALADKMGAMKGSYPGLAQRALWRANSVLSGTEGFELTDTRTPQTISSGVSAGNTQQIDKTVPIKTQPLSQQIKDAIASSSSNGGTFINGPDGNSYYNGTIADTITNDGLSYGYNENDRSDLNSLINGLYNQNSNQLSYKDWLNNGGTNLPSTTSEDGTQIFWNNQPNQSQELTIPNKFSNIEYSDYNPEQSYNSPEYGNPRVDFRYAPSDNSSTYSIGRYGDPTQLSINNYINAQTNMGRTNLNDILGSMPYYTDPSTANIIANNYMSNVQTTALQEALSQYNPGQYNMLYQPNQYTDFINHTIFSEPWSYQNSIMNSPMITGWEPDYGQAAYNYWSNDNSPSMSSNFNYNPGYYYSNEW